MIDANKYVRVNSTFALCVCVCVCLSLEEKNTLNQAHWHAQEQTPELKKQMNVVRAAINSFSK